MWKPTKKLQTQQRPPSPPTNNAPLPPNEGKRPKSDESCVAPLVFVGGEGGRGGAVLVERILYKKTYIKISKLIFSQFLSPKAKYHNQ